MNTKEAQKFINTFCRSKEDCEITFLLLKELLGDKIDFSQLKTLSYSTSQEISTLKNDIKRIDSRARSLAWAVVNGGM